MHLGWKFIRTFFLVNSLLSALALIAFFPVIRSVLAPGQTTDPRLVAMAPGALSNLEKLVDKVAPGSAPTYTGLGILYETKGMREDATRLYLKAAELDPDHSDAWFRLGTLYHAQGKWSDAIRAFEQSVQKPSRFNVHAYNNLGIAYEELGETTRALEAYEKALLLDPKNPVLKENLEKAKSDFEKSKGEELVIHLTSIGAPLSAQPPLGPPVAPDPGLLIDAVAPVTEEYSLRRPQRLTLVNGRTLTGDILEKTEQGLWLEVANGMRTFISRAEVIRIEDAE